MTRVVKHKRTLLIVFLMNLMCFFYLFAFCIANPTPVLRTDEIAHDFNTIQARATTISYSREWNTTFTGPYSDDGRAITMDGNNTIYVGGSMTPGSGAPSQALLAKYNSSGDLLNWIMWGGIGPSDSEYISGVAVDDDHNIYCSGTTTTYGEGGDEAVLMKFTPSMSLDWNITYGGSSTDYGTAVGVDSENNVYLAGATSSNSNSLYDIFLAKYDPDSNQLWNATWNGTASDQFFATDLDIDIYDNIYVCGYQWIASETNSWDIILLKWGKIGGDPIRRTWGGADEDQAWSVAVDGYEYIYVTGYTKNYGAQDKDAVLLKYQWTTGLNFVSYVTWGGAAYENAQGIDVDPRGNVFITGSTKSYGIGDYDIFLVKFDAAGTELWSEIWREYSTDTGGDLVICDDGFYFTGVTQSYGWGESDLVIAKYKTQSSAEIPGFNLYILLAFVPLVLAFSWWKIKVKTRKTINSIF
jgi:hypothetical protein